MSKLPDGQGGGECVHFHPPDVIKIGMIGCQLDDIAKKEHAMVTTSADAVRITNQVTMTMGGVKYNDKRGFTPLTRRPLFVVSNPEGEEGEDGEVIQSLVQSHEICFPIVMCLAKETDEVISQQFGNMFKMFADETQLCLDGKTSSILGDEFKALKMPVDADMKMHWSGIGAGGAAKVKERPCSCCGVHSDNLAQSTDGDDCVICYEYARSNKLSEDDLKNWRCFHKELITEEKKEELLKEKERLQAVVGFFGDNLVKIQSESLLHMKKKDTTDITCIHFDYSNADTGSKRTSVKMYVMIWIYEKWTLQDQQLLLLNVLKNN
jgi:hypothetical protein